MSFVARLDKNSLSAGPLISIGLFDRVTTPFSATITLINFSIKPPVLVEPLKSSATCHIRVFIACWLLTRVPSETTFGTVSTLVKLVPSIVRSKMPESVNNSPHFEPARLLARSNFAAYRAIFTISPSFTSTTAPAGSSISVGRISNKVTTNS